MLMRTVLAAAFALVVGLVIGGLRPRAEVRRLETELAERECRPLLGNELVRALQGRSIDPPTPLVGEPPADPGPERPDDDPDGDPDDFEEGRTILAARRAQARAALIEGADPTDEQLSEFDAAVADMNAELRVLGENLLARVRELGGTPPRSELYLFAADGLDVVIEADARMREALGDGADAVDEEALDPSSHVDPALVDLLVELRGAGFSP